ncbi:Seryl-tRNA synthetase [hydrothermal vent metagenome]|uniref:Serine--tRNA ligase n=1 Tax=hydrothermal vent metagenome TaxID=652676 RepID=A0A3B0TS94_9ZZZZ
MFDIKWIRTNSDEFDISMVKRGLGPQAQKLIALDDDRRKTIAALNDLQEKRNSSSRQIGHAKASGDEEKAQKLLAEVSNLRAKVQEGEEQQRIQTQALNDAMLQLPNLLASDVPEGKDENDNVEFHKFLAPTQFDFTPKEHYELGEALGQMDFETAARISGSRFVVLKGQLALLERALANFMLNVHTIHHGFTEISAPVLVRPEALVGTGQLPKFSEDAFETTDGRWLIPTSEVTLTNLVREQILSEGELPLRVTSLSQCFRSEAGSAGRDTRGMLRQHQFSKVEMVVITTPENSENEHKNMLKCSQQVLERLKLPYRTVRLCTGDMGATMRRTYDIEVWMPGQKTYREVASISSAGDWQARRMNARYRTKDGKVEYVHTLNGSGVAVGRIMIAVMENYQNADGSISIPEPLQRYMGGLETIGSKDE